MLFLHPINVDLIEIFSVETILPLSNFLEHFVLDTERHGHIVIQLVPLEVDSLAFSERLVKHGHQHFTTLI